MSSSEELESDFLGERETNILRALRTISALLSVLGSSLILYHVIRRKRQGNRGNSKNRLLAGLSLSDLIFSAENAVMTPLVYPITSPGPLCSFDGFVHSIGNAAAYYNAALSVYFLAVIRYNVREETFARRYEPFCHLFPLPVAFAAATTGLILDLYNPKASGLGCWVEDYPRGCSDIEFIDNMSEQDTSPVEAAECRGDARIMKLFPTFATVLPFLVALLTMIISNVLIYRFVRQLERRNARYTVTASIVASDTAATTSANDPSENSQAPTRRSSVVKWARRTVTTMDSSTNSHTEQRRNSSISTAASSTTSAESMKRSKKIATQSFCYIGAFFLCYLPGVIFWVAGFIYPDGQTNGTFFFLQVINALFFPAQGFFNVFVYLRPQYVAWREAVPDKGMLHAWRMAASLKAPPPPRRRQLRPAPPALMKDGDSNPHEDTTANQTNSNTYHPEDDEESGGGDIMEDLDNALSGAFLSEPFTCMGANKNNVSTPLFSEDSTSNLQRDTDHRTDDSSIEDNENDHSVAQQIEELESLQETPDDENNKTIGSDHITQKQSEALESLHGIGSADNGSIQQGGSDPDTCPQSQGLEPLDSSTNDNIQQDGSEGKQDRVETLQDSVKQDGSQLTTPQSQDLEPFHDSTGEEIK